MRSGCPYSSFWPAILAPCWSRAGKRVIGLDVHQAQITACAIIEDSDGTTRVEQRQFGAFKRDRRALAEWAAALLPDEVVMESTGIYWKSPYAALEAAGIRALVVNARHVKNVPGPKTDAGDAQWLATLARAGLLRGSFIPPALLRELRLSARQRQKLVGQLASEKNRLHKVLTDGRNSPWRGGQRLQASAWAFTSSNEMKQRSARKFPSI